MVSPFFYFGVHRWLANTHAQGSDTVEQQKLYARVFSALGKFGIRI